METVSADIQPLKPRFTVNINALFAEEMFPLRTKSLYFKSQRFGCFKS